MIKVLAAIAVWSCGGIHDVPGGNCVITGDREIPASLALVFENVPVGNVNATVYRLIFASNVNDVLSREYLLPLGFYVDVAMPTRLKEGANIAYFRTHPGSLGSLYGRSPHGTMAAFKRPTARTPIKGLYLCGGGVHPGAGVPMATLSGAHAAEAIMTDLSLTSPSHQMATRGGMSTA